MARTSKSDSMIKQIVIGVAVTVLGALAISYFTGVFDSNTNTPPTHQEAVKPGEGRG